MTTTTTDDLTQRIDRLTQRQQALTKTRDHHRSTLSRAEEQREAAALTGKGDAPDSARLRALRDALADAETDLGKVTCLLGEAQAEQVEQQRADEQRQAEESARGSLAALPGRLAACAAAADEAVASIVAAVDRAVTILGEYVTATAETENALTLARLDASYVNQLVGDAIGSSEALMALHRASENRNQLRVHRLVHSDQLGARSDLFGRLSTLAMKRDERLRSLG